MVEEERTLSIRRRGNRSRSSGFQLADPASENQLEFASSFFSFFSYARQSKTFIMVLDSPRLLRGC